MVRILRTGLRVLLPTGIYYEFFAGGGMVRAGLGTSWKCLFANDVSRLKTRSYTENWGTSEFHSGDIYDLVPSNIPGHADLAWASFPCQDLSVAGAGLGIGQEAAKSRTRSGAFWAFITLMRRLAEECRPPTIIVLENVVGLLTSNDGQDFVATVKALAQSGYRVGAFVIDASYFVPQSRQRVFMIAIRQTTVVPISLRQHSPETQWHPDTLCRAVTLLPDVLRREWIWWNPGTAPARLSNFGDLVLEEGPGILWHSEEETRRFVSMMAKPHLRRVRLAQDLNKRQVGNLHLRMRPHDGANVQRAEVNFASVSSCIRTPRGGGSRPRVIVVTGLRVRTRLLSASEAAKIMGLPDGYKLPTSYENAFQLLGDGVVVPVISFIRDKILDPLVQRQMFVAA